jgi:hypothetical protein
MNENTVILLIPVAFLLILSTSLYYYNIWDIKNDERKEREKQKLS